MKEKFTVAGVVVALALGVVGLFTGDVTNVSPVEVREEKVGAMASPDVYVPTFFYGTMAEGGGCFATSTAGSGAVAGTLTAAQLERNNCIKVTVNAQAGMTITLPATSTLGHILPKAGMHRTWIIENATTTAATTLTIAKGTGINLIAVTANDDVIDGTERSVIDCFRRTDNDWDCRLDELVDAD